MLLGNHGVQAVRVGVDSVKHRLQGAAYRHGPVQKLAQASERHFYFLGAFQALIGAQVAARAARQVVQAAGNAAQFGAVQVAAARQLRGHLG